MLYSRVQCQACSQPRQGAHSPCTFAIAITHKIAMFDGVLSELAPPKHRKRWRAHPLPAPPASGSFCMHPAYSSSLCRGSAAMAEECTKAASGCAANAPPLAAAAPPGDVEMGECPAAA